MDPAKRITAKDALTHRYFSEPPRPQVAATSNQLTPTLALAPSLAIAFNLALTHPRRTP